MSYKMPFHINTQGPVNNLTAPRSDDWWFMPDARRAFHKYYNGESITHYKTDNESVYLAFDRLNIYSLKKQAGEPGVKS